MRKPKLLAALDDIPYGMSALDHGSTTVYIFREVGSSAVTCCQRARGAPVPTPDPAPEPDPPQPTGRVIFRRWGEFFTSTREVPQLTLSDVEIPPFAFMRLAVTVDVSAGWNTDKADGIHALLWWHLGTPARLEPQGPQGHAWSYGKVAYLVARSGTKPVLRFWSADRVATVPLLGSERVEAMPLGRWRVEIGYATTPAPGAYGVELAIRDAKSGVSRSMSHRARAPGLGYEALPSFIAFGNPAENRGPEVPSYGWTYRDLEITVTE